MKLICAGMSKTGTKSVASALRILGYNVHDVEEHWKYYLDEYVDALEGKQIPNFATMYANVDAVTDTPASNCWKEIFVAFPDAKVLLMVRDNEEVWTQSWIKTVSAADSVHSSLSMRLGRRCTPTGRKWKRLLKGISRKLRKRAERLNDITPDAFTKGYRNHNMEVKSSIPSDQLLVYNVKQGWKPLCEFLGVEVPDVPFPRLNIQSESISGICYNSHLYKRMCTELVVMSTFIVLICAVLIYQIF